MSFVDVKLLNSDFKDEPLNYLSYIDSIEKYGDESYVFDNGSKRILRDLLANSTLLFSHKNIHNTLIKNLSDDDLYFLFRKNKNLGFCLNELFGEGTFSVGNFNNICEYMNMDSIHAFPEAFLNAFGKCVNEELNSDTALSWINYRFGVDLSSYSSLSEAIKDDSAWTNIIQNSPLMSCILTTEWFNRKLIEEATIQTWKKSDGNYYDNNGNEYNGDTDEKTGNTITKDTLDLLKSTGAVTESTVITKDSAYSKLTDALYWVTQNVSIEAIAPYKELIRIFLENDTCQQSLADAPNTSLLSALKHAEFAKQILNCKPLVEKIGKNPDAVKVLSHFACDIQTSYDALSSIKENLSLVPKNSDKIYELNPIMEQVQESINSVNDVMTKITELQNYTNLTNDSVTSFMTNPDITKVAFTNPTFVKQAASMGDFSKEIVKNSVIADVITSDERVYPVALASETFMNALFADGSLYESIWISDINKRKIIYNSENAMKMLGNNKEFTRRFINKQINYDDSLYPSLDDNFINDAWLPAVTGDEFTMDFMSHNLACADLIVDTELAINSIYQHVYPEHIETEVIYDALKKHGDVGFYKWFIQKAESSSIKYTNYASWSSYVSQMTNGTVLPDGFKQAIDNAPDLVNHVLGESSFLMEILFDPSKITAYKAGSCHVNSNNINLVTSFSTNTDPSQFLSLFESLKTDFKENSIFIGNMLYYMTRLCLNYQSNYDTNMPYIPTYEQSTVHKNLSEFDNTDFTRFNNWRTLYYYSVNGKCVNLKNWLYNSNIFMTKYLLFTLGKDINSYSSLEDICEDDTLFTTLINSDAACNIAFASPIFMNIVVNSVKNLKIMYGVFNKVETNFSITSNQDQLNINTVIIDAFKKSSLLIKKEWHVSDEDERYNGFQSTEFENIYDNRCIIVDIKNNTGTGTYGYLLGDSHELTVTGSGESNIIKFAKYFELKTTGKIDYIEYIPIGI